MTDPGVDMFCAQICGVSIITGSGPVYHPKGVSKEVWQESSMATAAISRRRKKIRREDSKLPWWHVELISHFRVQTVNTLLFFQVLLTWTCDLPLVSDDTGPWLKAAEQAAQPGPGFVIHRPLDRLPQRIDFCFPNLQERSKEKIKNTVSLKLNKNPALGRYLGEQGVTAVVRISLYRFNPSLACNPIISTQNQHVGRMLFWYLHFIIREHRHYLWIHENQVVSHIQRLTGGKTAKLRRHPWLL